MISVVTTVGKTVVDQAVVVMVIILVPVTIEPGIVVSVVIGTKSVPVDVYPVLIVSTEVTGLDQMDGIFQTLVEHV